MTIKRYDIQTMLTEAALHGEKAGTEWMLSTEPEFRGNRVDMKRLKERGLSSPYMFVIGKGFMRTPLYKMFLEAGIKYKEGDFFRPMLLEIPASNKVEYAYYRAVVFGQLEALIRENMIAEGHLKVERVA